MHYGVCAGFHRGIILPYGVKEGFKEKTTLLESVEYIYSNFVYFFKISVLSDISCSCKAKIYDSCFGGTNRCDSKILMGTLYI